MPAPGYSATAGAVVALLGAVTALADPAPFDLAGPTIEVTVTRGTTTLPVARVPNLAPGDRVWMKAVLSAEQSAHYLMVAAFLRGATDPPPTEWFSRCNTWAGKCAKAGLTLTVPKDARQLLLFLAPETGGDFKTLVNAVRGRPGVFVRTSQDLNQAALDHLRLEAYLDAIRGLGEADPARLKEAAPLLSRSLAIKVEQKCLDRIPVLQAPCLMQGRDSLIMTDGHSASVAQTLTSGPASDLAMEASTAPLLKSGYYSPFIGSLLDIARLLDSFHTAQYQYIPALASAQGQELKLALNAPPSFHDPKSVLVVALPPIDGPQLPPLRAVDPTASFCVRKQPLILPVEGAPLVFASGYAHDVMLRVAPKGGTSLELPARAEAATGGFAIDTAALRTVQFDGNVRGHLQGKWGFDDYQGPGFQLVDARKQNWQLAAGDDAALIVGRQDAVRLRGGSAQCVQEVQLQDAGGKPLAVEWQSGKGDELNLKLSLQQASAGEFALLIRQYGGGEPQRLALHAYAEEGRLESFEIHSGDDHGVLRGTRLDEVAKLTLKGVEFVPGAWSTRDGRDELPMLAGNTPESLGLRPGDATQARVSLKDGRALDVKVAIDPPRPAALLIGKSAQLPPSGAADNIRLANHDELPRDARLTFSLRAVAPPAFAPDEKIEVATGDGSSATVLDLSHGAMTLQNATVAVATLDPGKVFSASAFGPLRFRRVVNGIAGDWRPLATLVRLPLLRYVQCPEAAAAACTLVGDNLFLLDSVSGDAEFAQPTPVPDGFTGEALSVPRPPEDRLYLKLRDDPNVVSVATLEVRTVPRSDAAAPKTDTPAQTHSTPAAASPERGAGPAAAPSTGALAAAAGPATQPTSSPAGVAAATPARPLAPAAASAEGATPGRP